jgi:O-antigen/teichoic acid export membrane protein
MKSMLWQAVKSHRVMLINAGSLVGTTVVTGVLGVVYWWVAARYFPSQAVGLASASLSAMMLLAHTCVLGLGTLLVGELPRQAGKEAALISTALIVVGAVGALAGIFFACIAPLIAPDFQALRASPGSIALFSLGVSLTAITIVLDQALIGLLRGGLQFWRNALFALMKLLLLFSAYFWLWPEAAETIYATWTGGIVVSLLPLCAVLLVKQGFTMRLFWPDWKLLRKLGPSALQHHALNVVLQVPTMALPVVVTALLSATTNAWFYTAWMISGFVVIASHALTTVLYAINAAQTALLAQKLRVTLGLSLLVSSVGALLLFVGAEPILDVFGRVYAEQAAWSLRILVLGSFPMIIKYHYIAVCRIYDRLLHALWPVLLGSLLELVLAIVGALVAGLPGLSLGWVVAVFLQALFMSPPILRALRPARALSKVI